MKQEHDKGIALVLSLFLMSALSVIAASLMFLSQTETYASMNYRLMSQARYGGESGIHKAANYLLNTYAPPDSVTDPISAYDMTKSPVTLKANNKAVVLSANSAISSNYPVAAVVDAFAAAAKGTLIADNGSAVKVTIGYNASATLLSMRQIPVYGQTALATVQTWQITADGTIDAGSRTAQVEVTAVMERQTGPAFKYAAFADYTGCDALDFYGGGSTDSYDSTAALVSGLPATTMSGGNIGTNGNLTEAGAPTTVNGSLSTPRTGVGTCSTSNVTAWTESGNATVTGGTVTLPQTVPYTAPDPPSPLPPVGTMNLNSGCGSTGYTSPKCTVSGGNVTLTPGGSVVSLGDVTLSGTNTLHLAAGTYNINSISFTGNSKIVVDSGPVILNVAGKDSSGGYLATPVAFEGQMASNSTYDPTQLQIRYAGTGTIKGMGGSDNAALVYAPNATVDLAGGSDWYGAIIAQYVKVGGGAAIHYDRHLQKSELMLGPFMLSSFTWMKY
jgi:type IV pilus assembly PilX-like protein